MFGTLVNRTIFFELLTVFSLALLGITGLLLMAGIVAEATQHGLTPYQVLQIIPLLIPSTLPYTIPATTLLATCMVYGRLAHDNEIVAIKAAGISILNVVRPAILVGLGTSILTMGLYYWFIPHTHHLLRTMFVNDVEDLLYGMLKREKCINRGKVGYAMWVRQVHGRRLENALFKRRDAKTGRYDIIALAREAELHVDLPKNLLWVEMRNVTVFNETGMDRGELPEKKYPVELNASSLTGTGARRPRAMSWEEVLEERQVVTHDLEAFDRRIADAEYQLSSQPTQEVKNHLKSLQEQKLHRIWDLWSLDAELQMRPSLSFGCFFFVLVGCPVGIWFSKSDYLSAFITCFLPIVFVYYPLMMCGTNYAKDGKITPWVGIWAANVVMAVVGVGLFRRLLKN